MSYLDDALANAKRFESSVAWMYLDSVGLVTIGVGNMLPSVAAALRLPLRVQSSGDLAGADAIAKDFARVAAMAPDKLPRFYYEYEALILEQVDIDVLLLARVRDFESQLRTLYPRYDTFPDAAKLGLIDMIYNLGAGKLQTGYPHFDASVRAGDFGVAAQQCDRNAAQAAFAARNLWTRQQFLAAAQETSA